MLSPASISRGDKTASRLSRRCAAARAFGAAIGDGRTMIYAVTTLGHSAHITNA